MRKKTKKMLLSGERNEQVASLERSIGEASVEQLVSLLGELARLQAIGFAKLATNGQRRPVEQADCLLTAEEAAKRLGISKDFFYRAKDLPFRVRLGRRVRFSARGIEDYIRQRSR